ETKRRRSCAEPVAQRSSRSSSRRETRPASQPLTLGLGGCSAMAQEKASRAWARWASMRPARWRLWGWPGRGAWTTVKAASATG
ncbi:hypothetical protein LTR16_008227, partial [Cryomyces antarcticus]